MALGFIGALFRIDRTIAESPRKEKEKIRHKRSRPIVDAFFSWCDEEERSVLDDTDLERHPLCPQSACRLGAVPHRRSPQQHEQLALRREAVGRKNWLFIGSDEAGEVNATFTSLLAGCQLHNIEPWSYLRDIFCLLPR